MEADDIARVLGLVPHPEGGMFAETWRDDASTAIYFLLRDGEVSRWHRVLHAAEVWHHYAGAPLAITTSDDGRSTTTTVLGTDLAAGERPQHRVAAGAWQSARTLGAWTLAGCTVAPPFVFEAFELAPPGWAPGW